MKRGGILTVLFVVFLFIPLTTTKAAIFLAVNGNPGTDFIMLEAGQSCSIEIMSDDTLGYAAFAGFVDTDPLGTFIHLETRWEAGEGATATLVNNAPILYGYDVMTFTPVQAGIHALFDFSRAGHINRPIPGSFREYD